MPLPKSGRIKHAVDFLQSTEPSLSPETCMVDASNETIWATQKAIANLFGVDVSGISRHIRNILDIGELRENSTLQKMQIANTDKLSSKLYSGNQIPHLGYGNHQAE